MPTVAELLTHVRDMLDEDVAAAWGDDQLLRWANEAMRDIARSTRHLKADETIEVVESVGTYTLPSTVLAVENVYYQSSDTDTRRIPLMPHHYEAMDAVWGSWQLREGSPTHYTVTGYAPNTKLMLYPVPTDTAATLHLIVSRLATPITLPGYTASDEVDAPTAWWDLIVDYVEFKALRRDRDPRWNEARDLYTQKLDALINNADYIAENREIVPVPGYDGGLPRWLVEGDGGWGDW